MILFICFSTLRKETIFKLELYHSEKYIYKFVLLIIKHLTKRKDKKKLTGLPPPAITAPALRLKIHIKMQHFLVIWRCLFRCIFKLRALLPKYLVPPSKYLGPSLPKIHYLTLSNRKLPKNIEHIWFTCILLTYLLNIGHIFALCIQYLVP